MTISANNKSLNSIINRVALLLLAFTLIIGTVFGIISYQNQHISKVWNYAEQTSQQARSLVLISSEIMVMNNHASMAEWLSHVKNLKTLSAQMQTTVHNQHLSSIKATLSSVDESSQLIELAKSKNPQINEIAQMNLISISQRIEAHANLLARDMKLRYQNNENIIVMSLLGGLLFVWIIPLLLLLFFKKYIKKPLDDLMAAGQKMESGDFSSPVKAFHLQELDRLGQTLNRTQSNLQSNTVSLAKYEDTLEQVQKAKTETDTLLNQIKQEHVELIKTEKLSTMGIMVAGVAHELNNPLMGILNYVKYLQKSIKDERQLEILRKAEAEVLRLKDIVKNMLNFSHNDSDEIGFQAPLPLIEKITKLFTPEIKRAEIELLIEPLAEDIPMVLAEPNKLQQVLLNLLVNARDALDGQTDKKIIIELHQAKKGYLDIDVIDNGPGIADDKSVQIFDAFYTSKPPGKGTGLGLSVSQSLVQEMQGYLQLKKPRNNTTFTIRLKTESKED